LFIFLQSIERYHLADENVKDADIVIKPDIPPVRLTAVVKGEKLIKAGEIAAQEALAALKEQLICNTFKN